MVQNKKLNHFLKMITYILLHFYYTYILEVFAIIPLVIILTLSIIFQYDTDNSNPDFLLFAFTSSFIFASPFACYFMAKVFGVFKMIDELKIKFYLKLLIICLISVVNFSLAYLQLKTKGMLNDVYIAYSVFTLIPAYFMYKYFNYLTIKYPTPFEGVGYYCSIRYFRDMIGDKTGKMFKNFIKGLFRVVLYLAVVFFALMFLSEKIAWGIEFVFRFLRCWIVGDEFSSYFKVNYYLMLFVSVFVNYIIAVIFGVFKCLYNLKLPFYLKILCVVLIGLVDFMVLYFDPMRYDDSCYCGLGVVVGYLIYSFMLPVLYPTKSSET